MKWTRAKGDPVEYSTGYIGLRNYISISHTNYSKHYWYTYSVNGEEVLHGNFDANNWNEAERIAVRKIKESLFYRMKRWNQMLLDFNTEVKESENLL